MSKLPLFLRGAFVDGGRLMTRTEATQLVRQAYGEQAKAVRTSGSEGGKLRIEWRALV